MRSIAIFFRRFPSKSPMASKRGAFIVFEGIDRSGKSTQSLNLAEALNAEHIKTKHMRFPDRTTEIGKMCGAYLQNAKQVEDHCIHLLFSANRWEAKDTICQLLAEGTTLVVDRYAFSGVAYTAAKGYDLDWCKGPDRGLPVPDMVIYLELSVEEATKRGNYGEERYENKEFQEKVANIFQQLKDETWKSIDARKTPEELKIEIRKIANEAFQKSESSPLRNDLWK